MSLRRLIGRFKVKPGERELSKPIVWASLRQCLDCIHNHHHHHHHCPTQQAPQLALSSPHGSGRSATPDTGLLVAAGAERGASKCGHAAIIAEIPEYFGCGVWVCGRRRRRHELNCCFPETGCLPSWMTLIHLLCASLSSILVFSPRCCFPLSSPPL